MTAIEAGALGFVAVLLLAGLRAPLALSLGLVGAVGTGFAAGSEKDIVNAKTLLAQGIESRNMSSAELSRLIRSEYDRNKTLFASLKCNPINRWRHQSRIAVTC